MPKQRKFTPNFVKVLLCLSVCSFVSFTTSSVNFCTIFFQIFLFSCCVCWCDGHIILSGTGYQMFLKFSQTFQTFHNRGDLSWYTHHPTTALYMFSFVQRLSILMYLVLDSLIVSPHDPRLWREQNNRSTSLLSMYMASVDQSWFGSWRKNTTKIHSIVLLLVSTPEVCCRRHHTEH